MTRGRRQKATAPLERRPLALSRRMTERTARLADLCVGPRFNQPSTWAMKSAGLGIVANRLIGDDGARPEVGWVPLAMDEPPVPRFPIAAPRYSEFTG